MGLAFRGGWMVMGATFRVDGFQGRMVIGVMRCGEIQCSKGGGGGGGGGEGQPPQTHTNLFALTLRKYCVVMLGVVYISCILVSINVISTRDNTAMQGRYRGREGGRGGKGGRGREEGRKGEERGGWEGERGGEERRRERRGGRKREE